MRLREWAPAYAAVTASTTVLMALILPWWGTTAWGVFWLGLGAGYARRFAR